LQSKLSISQAAYLNASTLSPWQPMMQCGCSKSLQGKLAMCRMQLPLKECLYVPLSTQALRSMELFSVTRQATKKRLIWFFIIKDHYCLQMYKLAHLPGLPMGHFFLQATYKIQTAASVAPIFEFAHKIGAENASQSPVAPDAITNYIVACA
jgi:hypothetical protein